MEELVLRGGEERKSWFLPGGVLVSVRRAVDAVAARLAGSEARPAGAGRGAGTALCSRRAVAATFNGGELSVSLRANSS